MPPTKFWFNLTVWEQARFEDFQDGHLGALLYMYILEQNDLAILNLYVTPIPPIKFGLNLHYSLGGDAV